MAAGGSTLHSWMAKQIAVKNKDDHIDPRYGAVHCSLVLGVNQRWVILSSDPKLRIFKFLGHSSGWVPGSFRRKPFVENIGFS